MPALIKADERSMVCHVGLEQRTRIQMCQARFGKTKDRPYANIYFDIPPTIIYNHHISTIGSQAIKA
jgi:hypothetical protein